MTALSIDRRQHLELAWQRQQGEDELLKLPTTAVAATVIEVRNLAHLEQLVDSAGSAIVLLYCYSKVHKCELHTVVCIVTASNSALASLYNYTKCCC